MTRRHLAVSLLTLYPERWQVACNRSRRVETDAVTFETADVTCQRCRRGAWWAEVQAWQAGYLAEPDWHRMAEAFWRAGRDELPEGGEQSC